MNEAKRKFVKYVFLDVVRFSPRSADAQSDIVLTLNSLVRSALRDCGIDSDEYLLLPTGDGVCIALFVSNVTFDCHMLVALRILHELDAYNKSIDDAARQFQIRIGIHENWDILVADVNDRPNLAGAGINLTSRIMGFGDGNNIFISEALFHQLESSEKYADKFRPYSKRIKHSLLPMKAFQYIGEGHIGLSVQTPTEFDPPLSRLIAYYFAHAIVKRREILEVMRESDSSLTSHAIAAALYFLAEDSIEKADATETQPYKETRNIHIPFAEQIKNYSTVAVAFLTHAFVERLFFELFGTYEHVGYVETSRSLYACIFVTDKGKKKLKADRPEIWSEFELGKVDASTN